MKNSNKRKIRLGLFVLIGTLIFIVAVYLIGQKQDMFKSTYTIGSYFQNINGLKKGNNVRYAGIDVGVVKGITMINDSVIKIEMTIDQNISRHIKKDAIATIGTDGLVGNMIVNILPGNGSTEIIEPGDIIESYSKIRTDEILNTLGVTNENIAILSSDLIQITRKIREGKGTIGVLLNDTLMAKDLQRSLNNLKVATYNARGITRDLDEITNSIKTNDKSVLGVLMNDTLTGEKLKSTIVHLDSLRMDMETTLSTINSVVEDIESGEGALNFLTQDTTFVNHLKSTIENIDQGTDKFNENMEALKHNFLFRGYFRKLERQQRKEAEQNNN